MRADNTGTGVGTVTFGSGAKVSTAGPVSIFYNPSVNPAGSVVNTTSYVNPRENFTGNVTGAATLTAYMLVNTVYDLQNIQNNPFGIYALGKNIDAGATVNWNSGAGFAPIGNAGTFDGQGLTISNLFIAPTATNISEIGLFGLIGAGGVVQNLHLTNVYIQANPNLGTGFHGLGALAGLNSGLVANVTASGTINGGTFSDVTAGGLVGQNGAFYGLTLTGTIKNSSAAVNVTLGSGVGCTNTSTSCNFNIAGGLVGFNSGTITGSSARGDVVVGATAWAGGLVGDNGTFNSNNQPVPGALIKSSFATGNVSSNGVNVSLGGLVAYNFPSAMITSSYATGNVTATAAIAPNSGLDCSTSNNCQYANAGGLVGSNSGTIQGAAVVPLLTQPCAAGQTCATGAVSVGSRATGGGLRRPKRRHHCKYVCYWRGHRRGRPFQLHQWKRDRSRGPRWRKPGPHHGFACNRKCRDTQRRESQYRRPGGGQRRRDHEFLCHRQCPRR